MNSRSANLRCVDISKIQNTKSDLTMVSNKSAVYCAILFLILASIFFAFVEFRYSTAASEKQARKYLFKSNIGAILAYSASSGGAGPSYFFLGDCDSRKSSWRVSLMSELDMGAYFEGYDFSQNWNSSINRHFLRSFEERVEINPFSLTREASRSEACHVFSIRVGQEKYLVPIGTSVDHEFVILIEVAQSAFHWAEPVDIFIKDLDGYVYFDAAPNSPISIETIFERGLVATNKGRVIEVNLEELQEMLSDLVIHAQATRGDPP